MPRSSGVVDALRDALAQLEARARRAPEHQRGALDEQIRQTRHMLEGYEREEERAGFERISDELNAAGSRAEQDAIRTRLRREHETAGASPARRTPATRARRSSKPKNAAKIARLHAAIANLEDRARRAITDRGARGYEEKAREKRIEIEALEAEDAYRAIEAGGRDPRQYPPAFVAMSLGERQAHVREIEETRLGQRVPARGVCPTIDRALDEANAAIEDGHLMNARRALFRAIDAAEKLRERQRERGEV